jgi:pyruvate kinase
MRRTKIVATFGPATDTPERIYQLIRSGVNVARFNFSHGTHEEHAARLKMVREAAARAGQPIAVLADMQGPKIRTGTLSDGQPVTLVAGQTFTLTTRPVGGSAEVVSTTYELLPIDVRKDATLLLSDGMIELRIVDTNSTDVICEVVHGGELREHQGINLPGVRVSAPAVTRKDVDDLHFALNHDVEYIAISFVRTANDVQRVKELIAAAGKNIPVIAKLERPEAIDVLDDILDVADGVMVARGDLGVEIPTAQVPIVQKQIIEAANYHGTIVITATQMLESMISNPRPTRAEASDVANAIIDGTDAVMLSGETAKGEFPMEAVQTMALIAQTAEASGRHGDKGVVLPTIEVAVRSSAHAIAAACASIAEHLPITAIVVFTQSGNTARLVSQQRPSVPIIAFAHTEQVYRRMALLWGVRPMLVTLVETLDNLEREVQRTLLEHGYGSPGDQVVMTGGLPIDHHGPTNFLKIVQLGEDPS